MLGQPLFPVVVWFWTVWATSWKFFCGEYVHRWTPSILLKLVNVLNIVPKKHRPTRIITSSNPFCKALIPAFLKFDDCLVCPLKPWVVPLLLSARYDRHWKRSLFFRVGPKIPQPFVVFLKSIRSHEFWLKKASHTYIHQWAEKQTVPPPLHAIFPALTLSSKRRGLGCAVMVLPI